MTDLTDLTLISLLFALYRMCVCACTPAYLFYTQTISKHRSYRSDRSGNSAQIDRWLTLQPDFTQTLIRLSAVGHEFVLALQVEGESLG
jgi:hypothetical protein